MFSILMYMEELKILILRILKENKEINDVWKKSENYKPLNMDKKLVCDLYNNPMLLSIAFDYRDLILKTVDNPSIMFSDQNFKNDVSSRLKNVNSIQFKIEDYYKNHQEGKIPINKCLNDIMGIRMILKEEVTLENIIDYLKTNFPELKIIDSSKKSYKAVHVYFGKGNNYLFRWELQIWLKKDEMNNLLSHHRYKQDYIKWERKIGGV